MVSRRKILSRSRDDLHMEAPPDEEDVWYQKEKLFKVQRKNQQTFAQQSPLGESLSSESEETIGLGDI